jgi:hypothetical protein
MLILQGTFNYVTNCRGGEGARDLEGIDELKKKFSVLTHYQEPYPLDPKWETGAVQP